MVAPLAARGLTTAAVALPSCGPLDGPAERLGSLGDDVAAVRAAAAGDEPVVLVAHSYGGMVVTAAAAGLANVRHLVYVASMLPDADEPLAAIAGTDGPGWLEPERPEGRTVRLRTDLSRDEVIGHFLADCAPAIAEAALTRIGRQSASVFGQPPAGVGWRAVPSTAVVCTEDRATPPDRQRRWARRAGATVELTAGHHPFLSRPDELASIIADAAHRDAARRTD